MANYFPPVPAYPKGYDSEYTLFKVFNTSETITTADNSPWSAEINIKPVNQDSNEIWANNGFANIEGELFYYDSVGYDEYGKINKLKRCARNLGGTHTKFNSSGSEVRGFVVAEHHNQIVDAILAVEKFVGQNFSTDTNTLDWKIRNLQQLPVIFDDHTCPQFTFNFDVLSSDPATGILVQYDVVIEGTFTNYRLEFGDGEFTTTSTRGTHRYAPNATIDPIVTISNSRCAIVQSPVERIYVTEPTSPENAGPLEIKIPTIPDLPSFQIPDIPIPSNVVTIPPIVFPCLDIGPIGGTIIPSVITFEPPLNIPSVITFGSLDIPSLISFGPIDIPTLINFGPIDIPTLINFGPIDIPTLINFGPVDIPTLITFGPVDIPTLINFGPVNIPSLINFGPINIPSLINFGPVNIPSLINFGPINIPSLINFGPVNIPSLINFGPINIPSLINFGPINIPSLINFGPVNIPTLINFGPVNIPTIINFGPPPQLGPISFSPPPPLGPVFFSPPPQLGPVYFAPPPPLGPIYFAPPPPLGPVFFAPPPPLGPVFFAPPPPLGPVFFAPPPQLGPVYFAPPPQLGPVYFAPPPQLGPVYFAPPPPLGPVFFAPPPSLGPVFFGPPPSLGPITFGPAPSVSVIWGTPPTCSCTVTLQCPSNGPPTPSSTMTFLNNANAFDLDSYDPLEIEVGDIGIPSEIFLRVPEIPDIRVIHDLPAVIKIEAPFIPDIKIIGPEIPLPKEIKVIAENLPSTIELVAFDLPKSIAIDSKDLPRSIKLEVPEIPSIKIDASSIPSTIQVVGFPSAIELIGPSEIKLVLPEKPEVELVYRGAPLDANIKINLDISRLTGEDGNGQCVTIVPCNPKQ